MFDEALQPRRGVCHGVHLRASGPGLTTQRKHRRGPSTLPLRGYVSAKYV
ncbi:hypothetical protein SGM_5907 [Streptomyces griseoaurantiacus M045]|uniref:Uncharacterized protein n=1 Tax=Streptomyces griseoaurantiacus M045 TaxID=996637 RepID=F3NRZ3_9ACTN|nr:hypothetical protein SGM_5907 [Streptomyces griseoaurantiacus M045]